MYVTRRHGSNSMIAALVCVWWFQYTVWSQSAVQNTDSSLYLLSGTFANDDVKTYPVSLYRVDQKKMDKVREIAPPQAGLFSVEQSDDAIFVAYPHVIPSTMSVIHTAHPLLADEFVFNPTRKVVIANRQAMAPTQNGTEDLMFLTQGLTDTSGDCIAVSSQGEPGKRVMQNSASDYSKVLFKGTAAGPGTSADLIAHIHNQEVQIEVCGTAINVATLPHNLALTLGDRFGGVVAANDHFLVIGVQFSEEEFTSHSIATKTVYPIYILDRNSNQWTQSTIEGTCSSSRIFGEWMASTVSNYDFTGRVDPGASSERFTETATRPSTRELYEVDAAERCYFPGVLYIQNLTNGRKLAIRTDQEDSEILTINENRIIYRVNDEIYAAALSDHGISNPVLLVKDIDVPEVHWAFWSHK
jgi:hypothetical protein